MNNWIRFFHEGRSSERDLLGGKGANLAEMTHLGLSVPPGFTITTDACRHYLASNGETPPGLWEEVAAGLGDLEAQIGRRFGDPSNPLLLSVRSGARFSMPGMMETVLNIGLNDLTVQGLAERANGRFAYDSYRRLLQMFGRVVFEIDSEHFESALADARKSAGVEHDSALNVAQLTLLCARFRQIIADHGQQFSDDVNEQLRLAVVAVFASWRSPQAEAYRRSHLIDESIGTAVNVQAMVFGNLGADSASGVAFSRNPSTGEPGLFGEFLVNAQGEDVVAGIRTPLPVAEMAREPLFQLAWGQLNDIAGLLERHFEDMQDLEFTVENGRLWMLQTRTGTRTAMASARIAVDLVNEGLIDRRTAVLRVQPAQLEQLLHPRIDENQQLDVIGVGLAASPGAASGVVVFDPLEAKLRGEAGEDVILVRGETSAGDFPGMERARGILTARGGMTSHAAVVARGMGKPAVTGCGAIEVDYARQIFRCNGLIVRAGDALTIDGSTGRVMLGVANVLQGGAVAGAEQLLTWADSFRRLGVRANADSPADARQARAFGAEGIGLCRTEHMFFAPDRIGKMRRMILASTDEERTAALAALEPLQTSDFRAIFRAMDGLPVTVRLLDPPLHEFLPENEVDQKLLAEEMDDSIEGIRAAIESLREVNPMLGLRGVRLGILYPGLTRMQVRAIFTAAIDVAMTGIQVEPEIMIPLVADPEELRQQREIIDEIAEAVFAQTGRRVHYRVGTMIEVPRAALLADEIAEHADFFSFGTNDLTQMTFGLSRDDAQRFLPQYLQRGVLKREPFQVLDQRGVGQLIEMAMTRGKSTNPGLVTGVCGEQGGDPESVAYCHRIGLDYVSCSPYRLPVARLAAAHAALLEEGREDEHCAAQHRSVVLADAR